MSARTTTPGTLTAEDVYFAQIPEWVLFHPALSGNAVRLYGVLKRHANSIDRCWPGLETLGRETATSRSTVQRSLKELEAVGAVEITPQFTKGQQTVNLYHVKWTQPGTAGGWPAGDTTPPAAGQGGPAGDTPRGPSVTCRGPAGDTQTIAIEREPEEREVADPTDRAERTDVDSQMRVAMIGHPLRRDPPISHRAQPSPPGSAAPPLISPTIMPDTLSAPYQDWLWLCELLQWNPSLNKARACAAIKAMKAAGVDIMTIYQCVVWLKQDPYWTKRGVDLFLAQSQMQKFLDRGMVPTKPTLQDSYDEIVNDPTIRQIFGED